MTAGVLDNSAAIALSRGLPVHTANPNDFAHIQGLTVIAIGAE